VRFEVLTAASTKMAVFWVMRRVVWLEVHRRFRGAYCLQHLMLEVASTSETLVNIYQTTRSKIPVGSHVQEMLSSFKGREIHFRFALLLYPFLFQLYRFFTLLLFRTNPVASADLYYRPVCVRPSLCLVLQSRT
jgi:hypothetical protein